MYFHCWNTSCPQNLSKLLLVSFNFLSCPTPFAMNKVQVIAPTLDSAATPSCPAMVEDMDGAVACGHCLNPMKEKQMWPQKLLCLVSANIPQSWAGGELKGVGWPGCSRLWEHVGGSLPPWLQPDLYIVNPAKTGARTWLCELDLLNVYSLCRLAQRMKSSPIRLFPPAPG